MPAVGSRENVFCEGEFPFVVRFHKRFWTATKTAADGTRQSLFQEAPTDAGIRTHLDTSRRKSVPRKAAPTTCITRFDRKALNAPTGHERPRVPFWEKPSVARSWIQQALDLCLRLSFRFVFAFRLTLMWSRFTTPN